MTLEGRSENSTSKKAGQPVWPALLCCLIFALGLFWPGLPPQAQDGPGHIVHFAGSGNAALDQHIQDLLLSELGDSVTLHPITDGNVSALSDGAIVAIGPAAFSKVRQDNREAPILALLVERDFLEAFDAPGQISGIYFDVPLLRQALTGKAILPHANTLSILATPDSVARYEPLLDQLASYGIKAKPFIVSSEEELIPSLVRALGYGDFLLATPDEEIFNPRTIKHILLTAYRRNKIVIGPSQAYVRAGALASSYAPFPDMVERGAQFLQEYFETGVLPTPTYPERYAVEVNEQVARSLNIPVPDIEHISQSVNSALAEEGDLQSEQ